MKIIVIGPQGAGKTTVGEALAIQFGTTATDTSAALVKIEHERQRILKMLFPYKMPSWDHLRGRPSRAYLVALGDALKVQSLTILGDLCFAQGGVCVGVRRKDELLALCGKYPEARVLWVDRPGAECDPDDNLDIPWEWADYHFNNDGDLASVDAFAQFLRHSYDAGWLPEPRVDLAIQLVP